MLIQLLVVLSYSQPTLSEFYENQLQQEFHLYRQQKITKDQLIGNLITLKKQGNFESSSKLGELFLLGGPLLHDKQLSVEIDLQRAFKYLHQAHRKGSKDAGFYIGAILQQTLLHQGLSNIFKKDLQFYKAAYRFYKESAERNSQLSRTILAMFHSRCQKRSLEGYQIRNNTMTFSSFPNDAEICLDSCDELYGQIYHIAEQATDFYYNFGFLRVFYGDLQDTLQSSQSSDKEKILVESLLQENQDYVQLGLFYFHGQPLLEIEPDINKAIEFWEIAAQQNDEEAQYYLGLLHLNGIGTKIDYNLALTYFKEASKQQMPEAFTLLGEIYYNGWGVEKNFNMAFKYFQKAAESNEGQGLFKLAQAYKEGAGTDKDEFLDFFYTLESLMVDNVNATFKIGALYGEGLPYQSCLDSLQVFLSLIHNGPFSYIQENAYYKYKNSNKHSALQISMIGLLLGMEDSIISILYLFETDLHQFSSWTLEILSLCNDLPYPFCQLKLGEFLMQKQDYTQAKQLFLKLEDSKAFYNLGLIYEYGLEVDIDLDKSAFFYQKSIDSADEEAGYPSMLALLRIQGKQVLGNWF